MKTTNKELVGASTAVLILGVLKRGPSWGYDIVRQINEEAAGAFTWQEGTVYPLLRKLEKQGLVRCRWQDSPTGRQRKYYILTPAGRTSLDAGARQWEMFHELVLRLAGVNHA
ncbi:MAG TPA: PadR family transcriptional regulator [Tepidisphaeraceae bacterium]|jgi:PadR family transcriptional regulator PadR|nr:PadR family transcriptional regulator [Tepidisphaeraceae bacterium]